ncbi:MAG: secretin N-terminal domain-containing protein [Candidatus Muiribacteriota bacterium]
MTKLKMFLLIFIFVTFPILGNSLDDLVSGEYYGYRLIKKINALPEFSEAARLTDGEDIINRRTFALLIAVYLNNIEKIYNQKGTVDISLDELALLEKMILDFLNDIEVVFSDNLYSLSQKITILEKIIASKSRTTGLLKPHRDYSTAPETFRLESEEEEKNSEKPADLKEVAKSIETKASEQGEEKNIKEEDKKILHPDFNKEVSFSAVNAPVKNVLDALIANTGLSLFIPSDLDNYVTVQIKDMKLIDALEMVSARGNCLLDIDESLIHVESADKIVERVIKLEYADLDETVNFLNKLKSSQGKIISNPLTNSVMIYDKMEVVKQMEETISEIDVRDEGDEMETNVYILEYAEANNVLRLIQDLRSSTGRIAANETSNSLIVMDKRKNIFEIEALIQKLDIPSFESRQTTYIYNVKYGESDQILNILQSDAFGGSVAKDVKLTSDERTNSIVITGAQDTIDRILHYVEQLDIRTRQVTITAKIIEVNLDDNQSSGINWSMLAPTGAQTKTLEEENKISFKTFDSVGSDKAAFEFGTLARNQVEMLYEKMQNFSDVKVLSNPTITTLNNQEAHIFIGDEIPQETSSTADGSTTSGYTTVSTGIKLTVTPQISPDNYITLNVQPEIDEQSGLTPDGQPIISGTQANTNVIVKNGETLVIGGLIKNNKARTVTSIPILGDIPVIKNLFRSTRITNNRTETVVLITPHIIDDMLRNTASFMENFDEINEKGVMN